MPRTRIPLEVAAPEAPKPRHGGRPKQCTRRKLLTMTERHHEAMLKLATRWGLSGSETIKRALLSAAVEAGVLTVPLRTPEEPAAAE